MQAKFSREQALLLRSFHPPFLAAPHPGNLFAFFGLQEARDSEKPETWMFSFNISWISSIETQDVEAEIFDNAARLKQFKELRKGYVDEPWKSAFEWLPENQPGW